MSNKAMDWFAKTLLDWWQEHGRKDLPWQINRTPYRVWISEVMLQQTQVRTAIPYFLRFLDRFPSVSRLAIANEDEVLALWTGLGYYNRGRNLHRTAKLLKSEYKGQLPKNIPDLMSLPGIGRSTAGAVLSLGYGISAPILDANVKRVLARFHAVPGLIGKSETEKELWSLAESHTPKHESMYSQAIMDLGAALCVSKSPSCMECPLQHRCVGFANGNPGQFPKKNTRKTKPERYARMFLLIDQSGRCLIEKRPPTGVWPSLWGPPEKSINTKVSEFVAPLGLTARNIENQESGSTISHTFSHFRLLIEPVYIYLKKKTQIRVDRTQYRWHSQDLESELGLSVVTKKLLTTIPSNSKKIND